MDIRKRKIGFYYIVLDSENKDLCVKRELVRIFEFIQDQEKLSRKIELSNNKFCFMEYSQLNQAETIQKIVFKSATHSYRTPLIDKETVDERENPKTLKEGESYKSHLLIKYVEGNAILLAEKFREGLGVKNLVLYLNRHIRKYEQIRGHKLAYKFSFEIIAKDNIEEVLENMTRVLNASVYVDKQLLGSEALNFSNRLETVQKNIIIEIRASRTESIKETAKDLLAKINGGERIIKKIRIKGKNFANNDVTIDTEFIEKAEYVEVQLDTDTGEVNTTYIMSQLINVANTL